MTVIDLDVDNRGRISLGKFARAPKYRATARDDGSILLEPARVLTESEIAVLRNQHVADAIAASFAGNPETVELDWK